jgi:hypothetical protein
MRARECQQSLIFLAFCDILKACGDPAPGYDSAYRAAP